MNAKQYIREIVERTCLPKEEQRKIKRDLEIEISSAMEHGESLENIIDRMGEPDEVAAGLYENFIETPQRPFREYKSKRMLFGLPLVHIVRRNYSATVPHVRGVSVRGINIGGRYRNTSYGYNLPTARGIFAFGPKATGFFAVGNLSAGFISIGNISTGLISIGNISAGLFSLGNIALAILLALGNMTAGLFSVGNMAFGYSSAGNLAVGQYAVGNEAFGSFKFAISNLATQIDQVKVFFAGLDAPGPVKAFYSIIEKGIDMLNSPTSILPKAVTLVTVIGVAIFMLCIVPNRLLKGSEVEKQ